MIPLLDCLASLGDQGEIYYQKIRKQRIHLQSRHPATTHFEEKEKMALRIYKGGRQAFLTLPCNMAPREVARAVTDAMETALPSPPLYSPSRAPRPPIPAPPGGWPLEQGVLHGDGYALIDALGQSTNAPHIHYQAEESICTTRILNTNGLDVANTNTAWYMCPILKMPDSCAALYAFKAENSYTPFPPSELDELCRLHESAAVTAAVPGGKMKILLFEHALDHVMVRLREAVLGQNLHLSPLAHKLGQPVAAPCFSYFDHPRLDGFHHRRTFDDEGYPTCQRPIVEKGILKQFIRGGAATSDTWDETGGNGYKFNTIPNGIRATLPISDIDTPPTANVNTNYIAPGTTDYATMVGMMDRGILVFNFIGSHGGNGLNGDFSGTVGLGFYVEKGQIQGRVPPLTIAGNIYQMLKGIIAVEDRIHLTGHAYPRILMDRVEIRTSG